MGLTNELKIEEVWRWARSQRVPDGTTEIQKRDHCQKTAARRSSIYLKNTTDSQFSSFTFLVGYPRYL